MDQQPVAELARAIITQIAPRELPVFGPVSRAWFADPKPTRLRTGGDKALGYGLTDTIPLITHLLTLPLGTVVDLRKPSTSTSLGPCPPAVRARSNGPTGKAGSTPAFCYPPQKTSMSSCSAVMPVYPSAAAAALSPPYSWASAETLWP